MTSPSSRPRVAPGLRLAALLLAAALAPAQQFQTNQPASSLAIDGVQSNGLAPAVTMAVTNQDVFVSWASTSVGLAWEIGIGTLPLLPVSGGAPTTPGGQILNLQIADPTLIFLNGGATPAFLPFPGSFTFPVSLPVAASVSAQQINANPASADGLALSQGVTLQVTGGMPVPGPASDDSSVTITLGSSPLGGPASMAFYGTTYTQIAVISNGRIQFGIATGDTDFSPTVAEAIGDAPSAGFWTDLVPAAGNITVMALSPSIVRVQYQNVPYFGEMTQVTFGIVLNAATGEVALDGLAGIVPNPQIGTSFTAGDSQFLGISRGNNAATDGGQTVFTAGGAGGPTNANDMIYEFYDRNTQTGGLVTSLVPGTLSQILFVPSGSAYLWAGL